jgi:hypothetical protein
VALEVAGSIPAARPNLPPRLIPADLAWPPMVGACNRRHLRAGQGSPPRFTGKLKSQSRHNRPSTLDKLDHSCKPNLTLTNSIRDSCSCRRAGRSCRPDHHLVSGCSAPAIIIGLPVRNGARHVARPIESILAQAFTDRELIISDNASTDATPSICAG